MNKFLAVYNQIEYMSLKVSLKSLNQMFPK